MAVAPTDDAGSTSAPPTAVSGQPLTPVEEVAALVLASVGILPAVELPLTQAAGRVLAEPVRASAPLPRFDNAAMDGFAIRAADVAHARPDAPAALRLTTPSLAGQSMAPELPAGCACPIATGAPMPAGADAVVMVERAVEHDGEVLIPEPVDRGENVRCRGEDVLAGAELLHAGQIVTPAQIAAAAAVGRTTLRVRRPPRVTIVLTGAEVVPAGRPLHDHQVFDAVGPAMEALLADLGCVPATVGPIDDDPDLLTSTLLAAAKTSDAILSVGGASVGRSDHLKEVLSRHGRVYAWRVALRPAKPFVFGAILGIPVFGLPGNPASALAAYEVFVRPALLAMQARADDRPHLRAELIAPFSQRPGRLHLVRGYSWTWAGHRLVRPVGAQGAGMIHSLAGANVWMVVPADVTHLRTGALVEVRPMWGAAPTAMASGASTAGKDEHSY